MLKDKTKLRREKNADGRKEIDSIFRISTENYTGINVNHTFSKITVDQINSAAYVTILFLALINFMYKICQRNYIHLVSLKIQNIYYNNFNKYFITCFL